MPLTTESDSSADPLVSRREVDDLPQRSPSTRASQPGVSGSSDFDVLASAASPAAAAKPTRWDRFLLFNVAIPILLLLAGVLIVRTLGVAAAKPVPPPDTSLAAVMESLPATRVEVIRSLQDSGRQLELVIDGTVVPYRESRVSAEVSGRVVYKSEQCEAGAIVNEGDVLMRIDPTDYELDVERLTRQREQEYRALGEIDQEMINVQRSIEVAKQDVNLQRKEVDRQLALKRFASDAEVDRAKGALIQASQQLVTLENQVALLRSRRTRLEASEQLAATQLRVAEVNLKRCEIRAPISGVIVSEQADLNTFVNRGTPLVTIEDTSKVEVAASMRMDQLHWVLDQAASTQHSGYDLPDTDAIIEYEVAGRQGSVLRWQGMLVSYDGIGIDPNTRTVPVRVLVDDPTRFADKDTDVRVSDRTDTLLRGMFVRVRLQLKPQSELVLIPAKALRPGNRVWKFMPDDSVLQERMAAAKREAEEASKEGGGTYRASGSPGGETEVGIVDGGEWVGEIPKKPFDPTGWKAGRVKFSTTVFPIDSLRLEGEDPLDPNISPSLQNPGRVWVCEASKSDLAKGDFVVVSPLDSIPPEGLPARAMIQP